LNAPWRINLARLLVGIVFVWNVQCALAFLIRPEAYAAGFELAGAVGQAVMQSLGVLFLMWNVPYAVALWHPVKHRTALFEAVTMQAIGVAGESWILWGLGHEHAILRSSITRFIWFDAAGLALLLVAACLVRGISNTFSGVKG
jgi:hypothetical protein